MRCVAGASLSSRWLARAARALVEKKSDGLNIKYRPATLARARCRRRCRHASVRARVKIIHPLARVKTPDGNATYAPTVYLSCTRNRPAHVFEKVTFDDGGGTTRIKWSRRCARRVNGCARARAIFKHGVRMPLMCVTLSLTD